MVLPEPLAPVSARLSPAPTVKETSVEQGAARRRHSRRPRRRAAAHRGSGTPRRRDGRFGRRLQLPLDPAGGVDHAAEFADAAGERCGDLEQRQRGEEADRRGGGIEPSGEHGMGAEKQRAGGGQRGEGGNDEHRLLVGRIDLVLRLLQADVGVHDRSPPVFEAAGDHQFALAAHHVDEAHAQRLHGALAEARRAPRAAQRQQHRDRDAEEEARDLPGGDERRGEPGQQQIGRSEDEKAATAGMTSLSASPSRTSTSMVR